MSNNLRVVVFDLDGTLADTASIQTEGLNYRVPYDVLVLNDDNKKSDFLLFNQSIKRDISCLIQTGICVYIITRAPRAYASTLIHLLGLDYCGLIPASTGFNSVELKLNHISTLTDSHKSEMLYIGDQEQDEVDARTYGCFFQKPPWIRGCENQQNHLSSWVNLANKVLHQEQSHGATMDRLNSAYDTHLSNVLLFSDSLDTQWIFQDDDLVIEKEGETSVIPEPFYELELSGIFKPFVNPHFLSRYEYDNHQDYRSKLFELINSSMLSIERISPPESGKCPDLLDIPVYAVKKFDDSLYGQPLWALLKNWHYPKSGPDVHLHFLEMLALCLAAGVSTFEDDSVIVPVPSSELSKLQPGQVSVRLARRVSELTKIPMLHFLHKTTDGLFESDLLEFPYSGNIILIDDQITTGKNANNCVRLLKELGVEPYRICLVSWTSSHFKVFQEQFPS